MSLPVPLEAVVEDFASLPPELRIEVLLEYSDRMPPLAERFKDAPLQMEQVTECQTPFFLATELDDEGRVHIHFDCPPDAPTQRAFAGLLAEGLNGATPEEVLAVPRDFYTRMGLADTISALRLQGLEAILARVQRQVELARVA
ncbi:SufE family protein [Egibacter rhizosphaerae]|uniref:SufE family protein n=1 Tax=Egibacter rhizosphaerae TaxID=1670831 RepID=A0A411YC76_9ACTN|nr:SufE family protein [Egibacter rhizosphaerae]QBI18788.1 SufE family protein [Egibacter rhizosphaerae]